MSGWSRLFVTGINTMIQKTHNDFERVPLRKGSINGNSLHLVKNDEYKWMPDIEITLQELATGKIRAIFIEMQQKVAVSCTDELGIWSRLAITYKHFTAILAGNYINLRDEKFKLEQQKNTIDQQRKDALALVQKTKSNASLQITTLQADLEETRTTLRSERISSNSKDVKISRLEVDLKAQEKNVESLQFSEDLFRSSWLESTAELEKTKKKQEALERKNQELEKELQGRITEFMKEKQVLIKQNTEREQALIKQHQEKEQALIKQNTEREQALIKQKKETVEDLIRKRMKSEHDLIMQQETSLRNIKNNFDTQISEKDKENLSLKLVIKKYESELNDNKDNCDSQVDEKVEEIKKLNKIIEQYKISLKNIKDDFDLQINEKTKENQSLKKMIEQMQDRVYTPLTIVSYSEDSSLSRSRSPAASPLDSFASPEGSDTESDFQDLDTERTGTT